MIKASVVRGDGTPSVILGLSHKNLKGLRTRGPILIELSELGHKGKVIIRYVKKGVIGVPKEDGVLVVNLSRKTLERFKKGATILMKMKTDFYSGEIFIFAGKDEHTMEAMFKDVEKGHIIGSTCAQCGNARREDGSCFCKDSYQ